MLSNERAVCQSTCFIWVLQQTTPLLHTKDRWSGSSTAPGMEVNTIWAQERHSSQPLQTLDLLGLEVCRPCTQIHVIRSFELHNDTSTGYCSSTLVPHQCCSHHDSNWPPFNFSGHGGIGSLEPDISLTRKSQVYRFSLRPWCLTCHHHTLLQAEL